MYKALKSQPTSDNNDAKNVKNSSSVYGRVINNYSPLPKVERAKVEYLFGMSLDHLIRRMRAQTDPTAKDAIALRMMDKHLPNLIQNQLLTVVLNMSDSVAKKLIDLYQHQRNVSPADSTPINMANNMYNSIDNNIANTIDAPLEKS